MKISMLGSVAGHVFMMQTENVSQNLWKLPKIITFGADARLFSASGKWSEKQQTNRIYMTEHLQKEAISAVIMSFLVSTNQSCLFDYQIGRKDKKEATAG